MKNAQLTRGAFYSHFSSKSDLYAQAIRQAGSLAKNQHLSNYPDGLNNLINRYLSKAHRDEKVENLCPLAFLVTDINHQNNTVKDTYTDVFKGFVKYARSQTNNQQTALQMAALMIGGLALAKALNDEEVSDELLVACQKGITQLLTAR